MPTEVGIVLLIIAAPFIRWGWMIIAKFEGEVISLAHAKIKAFARPAIARVVRFFRSFSATERLARRISDEIDQECKAERWARFLQGSYAHTPQFWGGGAAEQYPGNSDKSAV